MASATRSLPLPHLPELDGVRGIAAVVVYLHHLCFTSLRGDGWGLPILMMRDVSRYGSAGVDVFFVLSGFLITSLLIRDRESPAFYKDFYWKRALRILPLYIVCLLGVLLFVPHTGGYVLLSALFIVNFANVFHVTSSGPFWSLAIEEQFYLVWPTVVRRRSVETLSHWAIALAAGCMLLRFACVPTGHYNYLFTFFRCDGLALGALIACRFYRYQREGAPLSGDSRYFIASLGIGGLLFAVPLLIAPSRLALAAALQQTGVSLLCAGAVGLAIAYTGSPVMAPLRSRLLTFFGLISYAFYMLHLYVMEAYDRVRGPLMEGDARAYAVRVAVVLAITIALSLLSRYLLELPILRLRKRVLSVPAPKAETEAPLFAD